MAERERRVMTVTGRDWVEVRGWPIRGIPQGSRVRIRVRPNDIVRVYVKRLEFITEWSLERDELGLKLGHQLAENCRYRK